MWTSYRVISTKRSPLESVVEVTGFFDHMNVEGSSISSQYGARQLPPAAPEQPLEDFAVATVQQPDGTYLFLRIPSHPQALSAYLQVTNDGTTFWTIGVVPACAGGELNVNFGITGAVEDGFYFTQPTGLFAENLPILPAGAVVEGVIRCITSRREIIYFRELESFGANVEGQGASACSTTYDRSRPLRW